MYPIDRKECSTFHNLKQNLYIITINKSIEKNYSPLEQKPLTAFPFPSRKLKEQFLQVPTTFPLGDIDPSSKDIDRSTIESKQSIFVFEKSDDNAASSTQNIHKIVMVGLDGWIFSREP
jgi:hypothetical protein